jgi:hypothetical protein
MVSYGRIAEGILRHTTPLDCAARIRMVSVGGRLLDEFVSHSPDQSPAVSRLASSGSLFPSSPALPSHILRE